MKRTPLTPLILTLASLLLALNIKAAPANTIKIAYLNVGQGDSILISDTTGFTALIDGGKPTAGNTLLTALQQNNITHLDALVATHADSDHIGGLINVLQADNILITTVYYNGYPGTTQTWADFTTAVTNDGLTLTPLQYPQTLAWGAGTAYILNPEPGLTSPEQNTASIVILLDYGDLEALFTGDIDTPTETHILAHGTPLAAELLKVAHHGSQYSSSPAFLAAVQPDQALISVGDNPYGHPAPETLTRLTQAGAHIWRTDQSGTLLILTDGNTYQVLPEIPLLLAYLPLIRQAALPTPTPTTPPSPTQTPQPPNLQIIDIQETGSEYVEIQNQDTQAVQLLNWTLRDLANHTYTFPNYLIQPGQICRIYTSETHPETCGFNYNSGSPIWNNDGDCAYLRDPNDQPIANFCY